MLTARVVVRLVWLSWLQPTMKALSVAVATFLWILFMCRIRLADRCRLLLLVLMNMT